MIRFVIGLLVVFGVAGGLDTAPTDEDLLLLIGLAIFGLGLMYSGSKALSGSAR